MPYFRLNRFAAVTLFALLCSCSVHLPALPQAEGDVSLRIAEGSIRTERVLKAGSPEAHQFDKWLDENARGWHRYYVTTPSDGIFVSTRLGGLQFMRQSVIAVRPDGYYGKNVSEDMYVLLREGTHEDNRVDHCAVLSAGHDRGRRNFECERGREPAR